MGLVSCNFLLCKNIPVKNLAESHVDVTYMHCKIQAGFMQASGKFHTVSYIGVQRYIHVGVHEKCLVTWIS